MENPIPGILFALASFVALIMSGYFFSLTKITLNSFLTINTIPLINSIMTLNFLFFCISASVGIGILISIGSFYELKKALLISAPTYFLAITILTIAFNLTDFFIPLILGLFAIPICIMSLKKSKEMKIFPIIRTGTYSSSKLILIVGAAFFLVLLITSINQSNTLQENFTKDMLAVTVGGNFTLSDQISLQLANAISTQQVSTVDLLLNQDELKNLVKSNLSDAIIYEQKLLAYKEAFAKDDFKTKISDQLKGQKIDFGTELLSKFPMIITLAQYAFIIYPISAFILFIFIGNILIKNIAGLIYTGIMKLNLDNQTTEKKA